MSLNEIRFGFLGKLSDNLLLPDEITLIDTFDALKNAEVTIGNSKLLSPLIYAPEINFYLNNTQDDVDLIGKNILALYKIRHLKFTYATDIPKYKDISNRLLIVLQEKEKTVLEIIEDFLSIFSITYTSPDKIKNIKGSIGNLTVYFVDQESSVFDQVIWFNRPDDFDRVGVYNAKKDTFKEVLKKILNNLENGYEYTKTVKYDSSICQYYKREGNICGFCADICPVEAIIKIDDKKELEFIEVNCTGCGGCISICPSGALDYAETGRGVFHMMSKVFKNKIPIIIPEDMDIDNLKVPLKKSVFPFVVGGKKFIDESNLLTLLQESGSQIILYNDFISKGTKEAVEMVNEIYTRRYGKIGVFIAKDKYELQNALENADFVEGSFFSVSNQLYDKKREIVSNRLKNIVETKDLGVYKTKEYIHYGNIKIDPNKCTLCLSCATGCNVKALFPQSSDNTLRFNPSICTNCGYCVTICPEDCMEMIDDTMELNPSWFENRIMAKDELFRCIECGKPFAPAKSIKKIAEKMIPVFGEDDPRVKTLYCCPECKPKVMLKYQIEQNKRE